VVKLGAEGALGVATGEEPILEPAVATTPVDTIGAGDAFVAGFIAIALEGATLSEALRAANACGASAVGVIGDQGGLPDRPELDRLLAASGTDDALR
jgi:2-dehydro-3-deoxygluconokinase